MTQRTFLGIDFGTSNVAVGEITHFTGNDKTYRKSHFIKFDPAIDPYDIHHEIDKFIDDIVLADGYQYLKGDYYAFIESVIKGPNARTFQRMTRVGHSVNIALADWGVRVEYLDNNTWRKELFGKGNTKKEVAQDWAYDNYPELLEYLKGQRGHRADALMIAEAGKSLVESRIEETVSRPGRSKEHR